MRIVCAVLAILLAASALWAGSSRHSLSKVAEVPLPGSASRFDYQSFYLPLQNVNGGPVLHILKPEATP